MDGVLTIIARARQLSVRVKLAGLGVDSVHPQIRAARVELNPNVLWGRPNAYDADVLIVLFGSSQIVLTDASAGGEAS